MRRNVLLIGDPCDKVGKDLSLDSDVPEDNDYFKIIFVTFFLGHVQNSCNKIAHLCDS